MASSPRCFYFSNAQLNHTLFIDASAMPTIHSIVTTNRKQIMNSKLLYAATVAVSLLSLSTFAMAQDAPLTREQVKAEFAKAAADGTLQRSDYDALKTPASTSPKSRSQILAELSQDKAERSTLKGPDADRNYNPVGVAIYRTSVLSRAEVVAEVQQARADGTLQRNDYEDAAQLARSAPQHAASTQFAQRLKAKFSRKQG
jgi:Domain of unknown function (DUF4148)